MKIRKVEQFQTLMFNKQDNGYGWIFRLYIYKWFGRNILIEILFNLMYLFLKKKKTKNKRWDNIFLRNPISQN